jgi:predicted nucleic acid-binding protein
MMRAVLADTGPLYAIVDPRDKFHNQAVEEMRMLAREAHRPGGLPDAA